MSLNNKQIRFLRAQAHSMKPVVLIGGAGLTDNVINEVNPEDRDKKSEMIDSIIRQTECLHVQTIGHIGIFYRQNKKNPVIEFPKK